MSNRLLAPGNVPPQRSSLYTIAGLFESGTLGLYDEGAMEEIRALRSAMGRMVAPSRGWMSPGSATDTARHAPRQLGWPQPWKRYRAWCKRWHKLAVGPSPSLPWGQTWAGVASELICEPTTFGAMAKRLGIPELLVVETFVRIVQDYGGTAQYNVPPIPHDGVRRAKRGRPGEYPRHRRKKQTTDNEDKAQGRRLGAARRRMAA